MRKLTLIVITIIAFMLYTGVALAINDTTPAAGFYTSGAGDQIPHGGYDVTTDACLQCHDVHESSGDYVLIRWRTVTDVCGSCHYLYTKDPMTLEANGSNPVLGGAADRSTRGINGEYNAAPGDPYDDVSYAPGYSSDVAPAIGAGVSVGSPYSAYEFDLAGARPDGEHNLQRGDGLWQYNDDPDNFKTADYIPGGNSRLTAIKKADYPNTDNVLNFTALQGLYCASCHTPHGNFGQQLFMTPGAGELTPTVLANSKILAGKPNHVRKNVPAITINDSWASGGGKWCAECHDRRLEGAIDPVDGSILHNHPDFACLQCHANNVSDGAPDGGDFPHSGEQLNLLSNVPDALCITCHVPGSLP